MSGLHTSNKVLLIANDLGMCVESYKHELDCVLAVINNGRLGSAIDPISHAWGSAAHAAAVQHVIEHAQKVAAAIAEEQREEAELERSHAQAAAQGGA